MVEYDMKNLKLFEDFEFEFDEEEVEPKMKRNILQRFADFFKVDNTCPVCGTEMKNSSGVVVGSEESSPECHECGYNILDTYKEMEERRKKVEIKKRRNTNPFG